MTSTKEGRPEQLGVSRETVERLEDFVENLKKWNPRINLVSKSTISDVWTRHILDSTQIFHLLPAQPLKICDMGSGGGFPGLVLAIVSKAEAPDWQISLIEADQRKSAFLRQNITRFDLNAHVVSERIEEAKPCHADFITARALAPLGQLLDYGMRHAAPGGEFLFLKGRNAKQELADARKVWEFSYESIESKSESEAVILRISDVQRR